jgi:hypothetical protein
MQLKLPLYSCIEHRRTFDGRFKPSVASWILFQALDYWALQEAGALFAIGAFY